MRPTSWRSTYAAACLDSRAVARAAQGGAELLRREGSDERGALATDGLVAVEGLAADLGPGGRTGVLGGRVEHAPLIGVAQLAPLCSARLDLRVLREREQPVRVQVLDLDWKRRAVRLDHGSTQALTTDIDGVPETWPVES